MEKIPGLDRETEVKDIGQRIEKKIVEGERVILGEDDRMRLRELVLESGIDLSVFNEGKTLEGVHAIVAQGDKLERALGGRSKLIAYLKDVIVRIVPEEKVPDVGGWVDGYMAVNTLGATGLVDYDLNSGKLIDTRIVAVVSASHRLLMIMAAESDSRSVELQGNDKTAKFLRERVLKGREKAGVDLPLEREIPRVEDKLTRSLPEKAVGVILNELTRK